MAAISWIGRFDGLVLRVPCFGFTVLTCLFAA